MKSATWKYLSLTTVLVVAFALAMAVPTAAQAGRWGVSVGPGYVGVGYGGHHHGHHHGGFYGGYYRPPIYGPVYGGYYAPGPYYPAYVGPVYGGCYGPAWGFTYWD